MFPIHLVGVALAGRMLLSKPNGDSNKIGQKFPIKPFPPRRPTDVKPLTVKNPFEVLINGLNRQLSGILKKQPLENYDEIVANFIPQGSTILTPKRPSSSQSISFADIDGDSRNELIASFRHVNEVKTIILKKETDNWYKVAEIATPEYESISYRDVVDLTGEGRKQLIIALSSQDKDSVLRGYSLDKDKFNELFAVNCNRLQVLKLPGSDRSTSEVKLAVWKRKENDAYNIELLQWNGSQLEPSNDISTYRNNFV